MSETIAPLASSSLSVNAQVVPWVDRLLRDADALRVQVRRDDSGACIVDAGIEAPGGIDAGLLIGEICMGGFGTVGMRSGASEGWPTWLEVRSSQPVLACLASQYAGWSLAASKEETGGKKFFALGSGPARALAVQGAAVRRAGLPRPRRARRAGARGRSRAAATWSSTRCCATARCRPRR